MDSKEKILLDAEAFARVCKALGHPARLRIVEHLKLIDRCFCGEIVQILPLAQSTVSQHLKILKGAGIINGTIDGACICYCLDMQMLDRFKKTAASI